jgi:outer membrane protein OmpA-like peptidoglycan-associated protein
VGIRVRNFTREAGAVINNVVAADIREAILDQPHISIAVNRQRFRLWVNEQKAIDIPQLAPAGMKTNQMMFELIQLKQGKERVFIGNVKVAAGGMDLRRTLMAEGRVSTNGILFESGSANIQPHSMGIIRQISQVLMQDGNIRLRIIGHTDADGGEASNLALSARRAEAVRQVLIDLYHIDAGRLQTEGRGETEPVDENGTTAGKARNRRVEFVKF